MRKLIYILLLIPAISLGQYRAVDNGKYGLYQGSSVTIQADNIPTSPENPPGPSPPSGFNVYFVESFDDWDTITGIAFYQLEDIWGESGQRNDESDSSHTGYGSYGIDIVDVEIEGETERVWRSTEKEDELVIPWVTGFKFFIDVRDATVADSFCFSFDVAYATNHTWTDPLWQSNQGKLPGLVSDQSVSNYYDKDAAAGDGFAYHQTWAAVWSGDTVYHGLYPWISSRTTGDFAPNPLYNDPDNLASRYDLSKYTSSITWQTITCATQLNTVTGGVPDANGYMEVFIDGKYSGGTYDMQIRADDQYSVEWIMWWYWYNGFDYDRDGPNVFHQDNVSYWNGMILYEKNYEGESWEGRRIDTPDISAEDN